jgi:hypothetical protein
VPTSLKKAPMQPSISDLAKAWAEEIEQRLAAFDRGEISAYPAEGVFADARRQLRHD